MRALYLSNNHEIGGGNRSLLTLWEGIRPLGVEPFATCTAEGPMPQAMRDADVPCTVVEPHQPSWREPFATLRTVRQYQDILRTHEIDLAHANDPATARSITLAAYRSDVPLVCHVRAPLKPSYVAWAFKRLPAPQMFIFNSHALRRDIGDAFAAACPESEQVVVHNAVLLDRFSSREPHANDHPLRVGIVANLSPIKGHKDFLDMAALLVESGVEAHFDLIGGDISRSGYDDELQAYAAERSLAEHVKFHGHVDDVPTLLRELDVVVCPSHVEAFGRCAVEALACRIPVVVSNVGGLPEVVKHNETGIVVPVKSPPALADAVEELLGDPAMRQRIGDAGRADAEARFNRDAHAAAIKDLYDQVLARTPQATHG